MPETPIYDLPFEHPRNDEPGRTLDGGSTGDSPILAEKVEEQLARIDNASSGIDARVTAVEERVFRLDQVNLSGTVGGSGTPVVIPSDVRGEFRSYLLEVQAGVSGQPNRGLLVRVNGIGNDEYRGYAVAWDTEDMSVAANSALNATSFPRTGYLGEFFPGIMVIRFRPGSLGDTGNMTWSGHGFANNGASGSTIVLSGGRWNGTEQEIQQFNIRTVGSGSVDDVWSANSNATLWGAI